MDKAVEFVQDKIDEFGRKIFGREIRVGKAPEALPLPTETGASVGSGDGPPTSSGQWKTVNESMGDFSGAYQKQITGQEGMILAQHFYCISNKIFDCHKLNDTDLQIEFDVSDDCQEQVLDILNEDIQRLQSLCEKYDQPVPKLMKLVYEPKTKKFNAEYKYENQTTDEVSVFDNYDAWFEEEKSRLENQCKDNGF